MKNKKIGAAILAFILIGGILFMANGLIGNPISKMMASRTSKKYVDRQYKDMDLQVEDPVYNFKDGRYYVDVKSNRSVDTYFQLYYTWSGKLDYDSYEDAVLSKWNTWQRIDSEYRKLVDSKIEGKMDLKERDFIFAELLDKNDNFSHLEIDEVYDIREMAKTLGGVTVHLEREDRDAKIMADTLFQIKKIFDKEEIPFYHIDIDINEPRREDNEKQDNPAEEEYLMIREFLYKDIYLQGLEKRIDENIEQTKVFYEVEDSEKQEEIDAFEEENK